LTVRLPDGSCRQYPVGTTIAAVAASIGKRLGRDAIGGVVQFEAPAAAAPDQALPTGRPTIIDVHTPLRQDCSLRIITVNTDEGLEVLRHSTAHLMASAVQRRFPGTQVTIGPAIDEGFYYDFDRKAGFTPDDLEQIEAEMHALAAADLPLERREVSREEARSLFASLGETYKCELIDGIAADQPISLYQHGDWQDLCRGPHVPRTGLLKAFKLTHVAGAYWRGDERNPMLTRIYGTAFWDKKALEAHFARLEEAKRRDHRRVGKALDLFSFHPLAPAMPFFHPAGATIYGLLCDMVRRYYGLLGFEEVVSPQIYDMQLFEQSGHAAHYRDNMFVCEIDDRAFGVKPMNCPGHTLIYAASKRSYRELPIRYADFGRLHRYERSGVTAGLTRVRSFAQDDAHIFCRLDQVGEEIGRQLLMIADMYAHFGFKTQLGLSTRPASSLGTEPGLPAAEVAAWNATWTQAEGLLKAALEASGSPFSVHPGDGAFYGPKIDCQVQDALGRWHQLGTIQLDFGLPQRFALEYTDSDSKAQRPVMIHRAVLGSIERFMGILLEHCGGDLPIWLAPEQARVLCLGEAALDYARDMAQRLSEAGVRVRLDGRQEKLGYKIRDAELHKIPMVLVVGAKEQASQSVSVRRRHQGDLGPMPLDQALASVISAAAVPEPGEALLAKRVFKLDLI
jgi:threonyl-tRNA synthetase